MKTLFVEFVVSKSDCKRQCLEDPKPLLTIDNYIDDSTKKDHGVKETCIFHEIQHFSVVKNISCDLMDDTLEGIYRNEVAYMLDRFINKRSILTRTIKLCC